MALRLTLNSIEGYKELPSRKRREMLSDNMFKPFRHYQTWIGLIILCICSLAGQGIGQLLGGESARMLIGLVGIIFGFIVFNHIFYTQITPYIEEAVKYHKEFTSEE